jgi:S-methylmethionine-dependent homocysteine/selenocysteine methylase
MNIQKILKDHDFILTEAAVLEHLRRSKRVNLHPRLENSLLIYDEVGKKELTFLYHTFIDVARKAGVPIIICTPTWRANQERLSAANITNKLNEDAVEFIKQLKNAWGAWAENIIIGGLIGCKNDCYKPDEGLLETEAEVFHFRQITELAKAGVDILLAATLPALPEAIGIALAMAKTDTPYIISFVINKKGRILDGNSLESSFQIIDSICNRPPIGYMINCSYPSFLDVHKLPPSVLSRLIGYQANASSCDHSQLDGAESLQANGIDEWGNLMIELNRQYGIKILGGCCGTSYRHLKYIAQNMRSEQRH